MRRIDTAATTLKRARQVGFRGIAQRVAQRGYRRTGASELAFNLDLEDILACVPADLSVPESTPAPGSPIRVGWVSTPPAPGSGGHTTLFRMMEAVESKGHECLLYLYDKHGLDLITRTDVMRTCWPRVRAEVRDVRDGIRGIDAVVASGWESAHLAVKYAPDPVHRLYFIQDYEPYFYARGAEYEFAALTYKLPFRRIVLGEMLDAMIVQETGLTSDVVPFGCDSDAYRVPSAETERTGIVFYCRPDFPRRGYQLAALTLIMFHKRHPDQEIHVYGSRPAGLGIPFTFHGRLTTPQLSDLYGRTIAGLAMSFTNITLVAEEMLAAGNIPVVNDLELAHLVLTSPSVRWAAPTAGALADQLSKAVTASDVAARASAAAQSVVGRSWRPTQDAVVRVIEEEVYGPWDPTC